MLSLKNIYYSVQDNTQTKKILKGISLDFFTNNLYVITGHNGSGKSTLAKIIMGIISPTKGSINLNKQNITLSSIQERVQLGLSFAFQQPVRFKGLTVKNLLDSASNHKYNVNELCNYLSQVGLCAREYIHRPLDEKLSGGELKRIELAMTLAQEKEYVIFDEPEAGIDLWSFEELTTLFSWLKEKGKCVIIISHQEKILSIADKIIVLSDGRVARYGDKKEILSTLSTSHKCGRLGNMKKKGDEYGNN